MSRVTVTEFTDPYSTWCWGAEPVVRRLRETYRDQLRVEYVMGGLVEDFEEFHDPANDVERTDEVAPHWITASQRHGMPVDVSVWSTDPPASSYPANVAYKAAEFQGREPAHRYLRRLREAGAAEARNLARRETLVDLAGEVGLDVARFERDVDGERAREAFEADLARTRERGGTGLPTFLIEVDDGRELLRGYRPFVAFEKVLTERAPDLLAHRPRPVEEFVAHWGRVATQEVAEVHELDREEAEERLRELEAAGRLRSRAVGNGYFWEPSSGRS